MGTLDFLSGCLFRIVIRDQVLHTMVFVMGDFVVLVWMYPTALLS